MFPPFLNVGDGLLRISTGFGPLLSSFRRHVAETKTKRRVTELATSTAGPAASGGAGARPFKRKKGKAKGTRKENRKRREM